MDMVEIYNKFFNFINNYNVVLVFMNKINNLFLMKYL